jgi:hypothetical protein
VVVEKIVRWACIVLSASVILALTIVTPYFAVFVGAGSAIFGATMLAIAFAQVRDRLPHRSLLVASTAFLCIGACLFAYGMLRQNFAIVPISSIKGWWIAGAVALCWVPMIFSPGKAKRP